MFGEQAKLNTLPASITQTPRDNLLVLFSQGKLYTPSLVTSTPNCDIEEPAAGVAGEYFVTL